MLTLWESVIATEETDGPAADADLGPAASRPPFAADAPRALAPPSRRAATTPVTKHGAVAGGATEVTTNGGSVTPLAAVTGDDGPRGP